MSCISMSDLSISECMLCGVCEDVCPVDAISISDNRFKIDLTICVCCCSCAEDCPCEVIKCS